MTLAMKRRFVAIWSVGILMLCGVLALASERPTEPVIDAIRLGEHRSGHTRVVLDMDSDPDFAVTPGAGGDGPALEISIANGRFTLDGAPAATGIVSAVALEQGSARLSLSETALPVRSFVLEPTEKVAHYRLVIDIEPVGGPVFAQAVEATAQRAHERIAETSPNDDPDAALAGAVEASAPNTTDPAEVSTENVRTVTVASARVPSLKPQRPARTASVRPQSAGRRSAGGLTIVIDPGHGGHDPGAIGQSGLKEKIVTWRAAETLGEILAERGYNVIFTREGDTYVAHDARIETARARQADMFLSIHADANRNPNVRGASIYTLSEARSEKMAREAATGGDFRVFDRELAGTDRDVNSILFDLANEDTKTHSARLASALIAEMKGRVPMVNNTHRKAGLLVLLSPDVPAVLVELAFLSNRADEANLGSRRWRRNTVTAIADGIDRYFGATGRRVGAAGIGYSATN